MGLVTTFSVDIQHNSIECHFAECHDYLNVMLSVFILNVIMLSVVMLTVVRLNVFMLSVIMLSVFMLNVIGLNVIMLSVFMLNVLGLNVIMLSVVMLNVIRLSVVMLNVVMLSVAARFLIHFSAIKCFGLLYVIAASVRRLQPKSDRIGKPVSKSENWF
jgi:hypothetical protein